MGVQQRREREKREQRQRILDAALQIITEAGFAGFSMRKLADRIEYSVASIYLYFENREEIAQELSEVALGELLALLSEAVAMPDAVEALEALGVAYVTYGLRNPQLYRLIFMGDSEYMTAAFGDQKDTSAGVRAYAGLLDLAKRLRRVGVLSRSSVAEVAELIWMTLHGIVSLQITCVGVKLTPAEKLARLATRTLAGEAGLVRGKRKPKQAPLEAQSRPRSVRTSGPRRAGD